MSLVEEVARKYNEMYGNISGTDPKNPKDKFAEESLQQAHAEMYLALRDGTKTEEIQKKLAQLEKENQTSYEEVVANVNTVYEAFVHAKKGDNIDDTTGEKILIPATPVESGTSPTPAPQPPPSDPNSLFVATDKYREPAFDPKIQPLITSYANATVSKNDTQRSEILDLLTNQTKYRIIENSEVYVVGGSQEEAQRIADIIKNDPYLTEKLKQGSEKEPIYIVLTHKDILENAHPGTGGVNFSNNGKSFIILDPGMPEVLSSLENELREGTVRILNPDLELIEPHLQAASNGISELYYQIKVGNKPKDSEEAIKVINEIISEHVLLYYKLFKTPQDQQKPDYLPLEQRQAIVKLFNERLADLGFADVVIDENFNAVKK
jgi:hypothetical protein